MRPSSGGSRRISKWFLPAWACVAISTARPESGTAAAWACGCDCAGALRRRWWLGRGVRGSWRGVRRAEILRRVGAGLARRRTPPPPLCVRGAPSLCTQVGDGVMGFAASSSPSPLPRAWRPCRCRLRRAASLRIDGRLRRCRSIALGGGRRRLRRCVAVGRLGLAGLQRRPARCAALAGSCGGKRGECVCFRRRHCAVRRRVRPAWPALRASGRRSGRATGSATATTAAGAAVTVGGVMTPATAASRGG